MMTARAKQQVSLSVIAWGKVGYVAAGSGLPVKVIISAEGQDFTNGKATNLSGNDRIPRFHSFLRRNPATTARPASIHLIQAYSTPNPNPFR